MTITICGSMKFHEEMKEIRDALVVLGHTVLVPKDLDDPKVNETDLVSDEEKISAKIEHDFIREHFRKIEGTDAILVLNYEKNGIHGYIGGNTFLEMGLAYWLDKKIYLMYPVPQMDYKTEMASLQPTVIDGDLSLIQ